MPTALFPSRRGHAEPAERDTTAAPAAEDSGTRKGLSGRSRCGEQGVPSRGYGAGMGGRPMHPTPQKHSFPPSLIRVQKHDTEITAPNTMGYDTFPHVVPNSRGRVCRRRRYILAVTQISTIPRVTRIAPKTKAPRSVPHARHGDEEYANTPRSTSLPRSGGASRRVSGAQRPAPG